MYVPIGQYRRVSVGSKHKQSKLPLLVPGIGSNKLLIAVYQIIALRLKEIADIIISEVGNVDSNFN